MAFKQAGQSGVKAILLQQLIAMLSKPGALGDLTASFQKAGLGAILQSWIGKGDNPPISADQVKSVLGNVMLSGLASKADVQPSQAADMLISLLPQVVDKVSPGGMAGDVRR